jgi:hypothetical protein
MKVQYRTRSEGIFGEDANEWLPEEDARQETADTERLHDAGFLWCHGRRKDMWPVGFEPTAFSFVARRSSS